MSGIPADLYPRVRQSLLECGDCFTGNDTLRDVFSNALLAPWRYRLPERANVTARIEATISFLEDKRRADTQANALVLLLRVLADRIDPDDDCHDRLSRLAHDLDTALRGRFSSSPVRAQYQAGFSTQQMIFTAEYEKLLQSLAAVGQVNVPRIVNGRVTEQIPSGTGWLIAPGLVLTCFHVIAARDALYDEPIAGSDFSAQVTNTVVIFDYKRPGEAVEYRVAECAHGDRNLDYALLRIEDRPDSPLRRRGPLALDAHAPLTVQTRLFVIQHPWGQPQQSSSGRFVAYGESAATILYSAPTEPGTSGAPVLNVANWAVVALHNAADSNQDLRIATLIKDILSDLQHACPQVHHEIVAAQSAEE